MEELMEDAMGVEFVKDKEPDLFRMQMVANRCKESMREEHVDELLRFAFKTLDCSVCVIRKTCSERENRKCGESLVRYVYRDEVIR